MHSSRETARSALHSFHRLLALLLLLACGCRLPFPTPCFVKRVSSSFQLRSLQGIDLEKESLTEPIVPQKTTQTTTAELLPATPVNLEAKSSEESKPPSDAQESEQTKGKEVAGEDAGKVKDEASKSQDEIETEEVAPGKDSKSAILPMSLAEARASSLQSNLDLSVSLVNPAIARQAVNVEAARFQAIFDSNYVRNRIDAPPGLALGGDPDSTFDQFGFSATQPLTTGGQISLRHSINKSDIHFIPAPNTLNTLAGVELRQPLLRNAGYQVSTANIQIARTQAGVADAQAKLTAIQVLNEVERAYWSAYSAQRFLSIAEQQYDLAEEQVTSTKKLVKAGFVTVVDEYQAEAGLLIRRSSVITAETNFRLAQRALKRIMLRADLPVDSMQRLDFVTPPNPLGLTFDRDGLATRAVENRMELLQIRLQLVANGIDITVQQNSRLPKLDLIADLDALGLASAYGDSFESLESGQFGNRLGGLALQMPIGPNYAALARLEQARLRQQQLVINQRRVQVAVTQQVYDAVDRVELSWESFLAARQSVEISQKAYIGERKLHAAGRSTSINVLIAIANLGDAQTREVQAATDYQIAKVDLALALGAMLGYGQVEFDPIRGAVSPLAE